MIRQQPQPNIDPLIGAADLAAMLGVHLVTVYRTINNDPELRKRMVRIGNQWKIKFSEANSYVETKRVAER